MSRSKIIIITIATGLVVFGLCRTILAQTTQLATDNLKDMPFLELVDLKVSLTSEIAELEQILKDLPRKISDAEKIGRELESLDDQVKQLKEKKPKTDEDDARLFRLMTATADLKDQLGDKTAEALKAEMRNLEMKLNEKKAMMQNVRKTLAGIYTPEQTFKRTMSITFAVLIGLVIIGFFVLSYIDPTIRQAIFSGQTGIQFLTLFSLVIAIILFGITGILQDKELAALLGGLSGYILGRYNQPREGAADAAVPAPNPQGAQAAQGAAAAQGAQGIPGAQGVQVPA